MRQNRKVILLAFAIAAFNQLSGINAILYYAPDIFRSAGAGDNAAALESVIIGLVNLIVTMAALTVIDKIGRRKLMIVGSIGYLVSLGVLAGVFFAYEGQFSGFSSVLVLGGLVVFIAAHAFGQGSVIWVFISEIFPNRIRGRGQSLGSLTHWVFAAVVSAIFPAIAAALGGGMAFSLFFVCMVGQLVWVLKVMPETRGVPLEEMEANLGIELSEEDMSGARSGAAGPLSAGTDVSAATNGRCARTSTAVGFTHDDRRPPAGGPAGGAAHAPAPRRRSRRST